MRALWAQSLLVFNQIISAATVLVLIPRISNPLAAARIYIVVSDMEQKAIVRKDIPIVALTFISILKGGASAGFARTQGGDVTIGQQNDEENHCFYCRHDDNDRIFHLL